MTELTNNELNAQTMRILAAKLGLHAGMIVYRDSAANGRQCGVVVLGYAISDDIKVRCSDGSMWAASHKGNVLGWKPVVHNAELSVSDCESMMLACRDAAAKHTETFIMG